MICQACSHHAGRLDTSRHHGGRREDDVDLRTLAASLAAMADKCCKSRKQSSPSTWAQHGGQLRERRRLGERL